MTGEKSTQKKEVGVKGKKMKRYQKGLDKPETFVLHRNGYQKKNGEFTTGYNGRMWRKRNSHAKGRRHPLPVERNEEGVKQVPPHH